MPISRSDMPPAAAHARMHILVVDQESAHRHRQPTRRYSHHTRAGPSALFLLKIGSKPLWCGWDMGHCNVLIASRVLAALGNDEECEKQKNKSPKGRAEVCTLYRQIPGIRPHLSPPSEQPICSTFYHLSRIPTEDIAALSHLNHRIVSFLLVRTHLLRQ